MRQPIQYLEQASWTVGPRRKNETDLEYLYRLRPKAEELAREDDFRDRLAAGGTRAAEAIHGRYGAA